MATTINASTSSGLVSTADTSGVLQLQTAGTTAVTVDTAGNLGLGITPSASWSGQKAFQVDPKSAFTGSTTFTGVVTNAVATTTGWLANYLTTGTASLYAQSVSTGNHTWYTAPSGTAGSAITFTQVLALNKDQTVALQGASLQNGCGITFPATQVTSTDANTLDDYEEGTWTPSIGGTATYNTQSGTYVKIGNTVFYTFLLQINVKGTGNNYTVTGFPFSTSGVIRGGPNYYANLPLTITSMIFLGSGAAQIDVYSTTAAANNVTSNTVFGNGADIRGYGFYTT